MDQFVVIKNLLPIKKASCSALMQRKSTVILYLNFPRCIDFVLRRLCNDRSVDITESRMPSSAEHAQKMPTSAGFSVTVFAIISKEKNNVDFVCNIRALRFADFIDRLRFI